MKIIIKKNKSFVGKEWICDIESDLVEKFTEKYIKLLVGS
jgi:hypothetical protein